jgi:predicted O-methyltransferase YrrM
MAYNERVLPLEAECGWSKLYYNTVDTLLRSTPARNMVEIGVAHGFHLRHLMREHPNLTYIGVDPYAAGYDAKDPFCAEVAGIFGTDAVNAMAMLGDAVHAMAAAEYPGRCMLLRQPSVEAVRRVSGQFDMVFVDGNHTYKAVQQDLRAWWPRVRPGGILCGDDYYMPEVRQAVVEFARDIGRTHVDKAGGKHQIYYFRK